MIGETVFGGCIGITSIRIPESVTAIGEMAFLGCTGLSSIEIPGTVTSIDENAFYACEDLTMVVEKDSYAEQYAKDHDIDFSYG